MSKATNIEIGKSEIIGSRNFRHSADIENFYRFVYQKGLREEAKMLLKAFLATVVKPKKQRKRAKKNTLH